MRLTDGLHALKIGTEPLQVNNKWIKQAISLIRFDKGAITDSMEKENKLSLVHHELNKFDSFW
jgi:hypothetical protein